MSEWFNDSKQVEHFLLVQLNKSEVQYHFLNTFVNVNQADIEKIINASVYQPELLPRAKQL